MKPLDEIMVSEAKLKLILGGLDIKYPFPKEGKRKLPVSLWTILNHKGVDRYGSQLEMPIANVRSFDDRFDRKHPVNLALDYIETNGVRKDILTKIYQDKNCIRMHKMVGNYAVYNDLLSDDQRLVIENRLKWEDDQIKIRKAMVENWGK